MFYVKLCVYVSGPPCFHVNGLSIKSMSKTIRQWHRSENRNPMERNGWCNKRKLARWKECGESKVHLVAVHNVMLSHVISCFSRMLFFSMVPFVALHGLVDCC